MPITPHPRGVIELDRIHRFTQPWERDASVELRRGNSDAFDDYQVHGRLHDGTRIDMQRAVLKAWSEHRGDGDNTVMLAVTNDTVHALNEAAQAATQKLMTGDLSGVNED